MTVSRWSCDRYVRRVVRSVYSRGSTRNDRNTVMSHRQFIWIIGATCVALIPANVLAHNNSADLRVITSNASPASTQTRVGRTVRRFHGGRASSYGPGLYGNTMACGGTLQVNTIAVAHRTLKCGAVLEVCNESRSRCINVPVRDRGPFARHRTHDLSVGAVRAFGVSSATSWGVREIKWRCVRRCR